MTPSKDVDGGWAWCVLMASYFNLMMCSGLSIISGIFQMILLEEFKGSVAITSWITAFFSGSMQMAGPLSSMVSNRYSCRTSVMLGGALMSIGFAISSLADNLTVLFLSLGVTAGLGLGLIYTSSIVVVSYFFHERRAIANGIILSGSGFGICLTPQIARLLYDNFTWRETFVILGAVSAQMCISGALMFSCNEREDHSDKGSCRDGGLFRKILTTFLCFRFKDSQSAKESSAICPNEKGEDILVDEVDRDILEMTPPLRPVTRVISQGDCDDVSNGKNTVESRIENLEGSSCPKLKENENDRKDSRVLENMNTGIHPCLQKAVQVKRLHGDFRHIYGSKLIFNSHRNIREIQKSVSQENALTFQRNSHSLQELAPCKNIRGQNSSSINFDEQKSLLDIPMLITVNKSMDHDVSDSRSLRNDSHRGSGFVVVSRNPSLISGLVASARQLDIIVCDSKEDLEKHKIGNFLERNIVFKTAEISDEQENPKEEKVYASCDVIDSLGTITHPKLYKNQLFWILNLGLFIFNAGCGLFNIHLPSFLAETKGLAPHQIANIISMHGMMILLGRILCGVLANSTKDMDLLLYIMLQILGGIVICLFPPLGDTYASNMVLTGLVALHGIANYAVLPTLTIQFVGIQNLATAFGVEMVFSGLGYLVAPPLAGTLVDSTGSYNYSMYISGSLFMLAGAILFVVPFMLTSLPWYKASVITSTTASTEKENNSAMQSADVPLVETSAS